MHVDHLVIGAGPSGLACALRLALAGDRVALLESHTKIGGLNSYYSRSFNFKGQRQKVVLDSGLHAITNFSLTKDKLATFNRLKRSLRMQEAWTDLLPQEKSIIKVASKCLTFSNEPSELRKSIATEYPTELLAWDKFWSFVQAYNEFDPSQPNYISAQEELKKFFTTQEFIQHLLFPVLTYGSAWENDMDFNLFICLFRSMFMEGLCRPLGGINSWWNPLVKSLINHGVTSFLGEEVKSITRDTSELLKVTTSKREISCKKVFSSAGHINTESLLGNIMEAEARNLQSVLGFVELMLIVEGDLSKNNDLPSLGFFSSVKENIYCETKHAIDTSMIVYCFPSRFQNHPPAPTSVIRMTAKTSPTLWFKMDEKMYKAQKEELYVALKEQLYKDFPQVRNHNVVFSDLFTPKTIHRYTKHPHGALYGCTKKSKSGQTSLPGVYLIGADQGYPGIVGGMLSGISMANIYGIMETKKSQATL